MSYDDTLATDRDRARSLIGDTDESAELHSDEHIDAVLTEQGSLGMAVSYLAHELVVRYEQDPISFRDAGGEFNFSQRLTTWRLLATAYRTVITAQAAASVAAASSSPFSSVAVTYSGDSTTDEYGRSGRYC